MKLNCGKLQLQRLKRREEKKNENLFYKKLFIRFVIRECGRIMKAWDEHLISERVATARLCPLPLDPLLITSN